MVAWEARRSLHAALVQEPEIERALLTYEAGTAFRPGFLIVLAPTAGEQRLAELRAVVTNALGRYAEHVPFVCANETPEAYRGAGCSIVFDRKR